MIGNAFMHYFKKKEPVVKRVPRQQTPKDLVFTGRMADEMSEKEKNKMRRRMLAESMAEPEE